MSMEYDEKVVAMRFENGQFEQGAKTSISTLDKLKQSLKLEDSAKSLDNLQQTASRFNMSSMGSAIESVGQKFSILETVAKTVVFNLTNSVVDGAKQILSSTGTIKSAMDGFQEYETQINAVQTILSNTRSKGTNLEQVNAALDELNKYADMTIYNFTEMTRNIGTFTAAGVDLDTSVSAIKGIANLAAVSGSTSQQASTAMYQLSQALSSGTVKLQDWNSVVNAGMGGQVFQDALMETARVHGVAIDDMVKKEGSFRETLKNGWLTAEVLTETLNKFTGDLTTKELEALGYTKEQAKSIRDLGDDANKAATKVKTFTQLKDTIAEAMQSGWTQSWEIIIGDFEEARELFTEISDTLNPLIEQSANARNSILEVWAVKGRPAAIEALKNAFDALMSVVEPIKQALSDVFPKVSGERLAELTQNLADFTKSLILTDEEAEKVRKAFAGFFSIVKIGVDFIKSLGQGVLELIKGLNGVDGDILDVAANLGEWAINMRKTLEGMNFFDKMADKLKSTLGMLGDKISEVSGLVSKNFKMPSFEGFVKVLSGIWNFISKIGSKIAAFGAQLGSVLTNALDTDTIEDAFNILNSALGSGILIGIKNFINDIGGGFGDAIENINDAFKSLGGVLETYQKSMNADILKKIATSIAILAGSLWLLASIDPQKLTTAIAAMTGLMAELLGSVALLGNMDLGKLSKVGATMTIIEGAATAILILAGAMKILSTINLEDSIKGLTVVGVLLTELSLFVSKTDFKKGMITAGAAMIEMGIALNILALALKQFGNMSLEQIGKGLGTMAGALTAIVLAFKMMPDKGSFGNGAALLVAAAGIEILALALGQMGNMDGTQIASALITMAFALGELVIALNLMEGTLPGSAALLIAATAIGVLTPALLLLGQMNGKEIGAALITLAGALTIMGVAGLLLMPVIPAIIALAGSLALIGVAVAGIGAGVALAGVGLSALATGIGMLATVTAGSATAIVASLSVIITGLVTLLPTVASEIAKSIGSFAETLGDVIPTIVEAGKKIILALLEGIVDIVPNLVDTGLTLVVSLLESISKNIKKIVTLGMNIVIGFIEGIKSKLPELLQTAVEFIVTFVDGLARSIDNNSDILIESFENLIISVLNLGLKLIKEAPALFRKAFDSLMDSGIIESIVSNTVGVVTKIGAMISKAVTAIKNGTSDFIDAGKYVIEGFIDGILDKITAVKDAAKSIGTATINALKKILDIHSPSKEAAKLGAFTGEGFVNALTEYGGKVGKASTSIGQQAIDGLSNAISSISDYLSNDMDTQPTIKPILDLSGVSAGAATIGGMFNNATVGVSANVNAINAMMSTSQNGSTNDDVISAINKLGASLSGNTGNVYNVNGITYDDGSNISTAVQSLIRATRMERRM